MLCDFKSVTIIKHTKIKILIKISALLLITTGITPQTDVGVKLNEIVNGSSFDWCLKGEEYPQQIYGASGRTLNGSPVICGGIFRDSDTKNRIDKCYIYKKVKLKCI